jgi:SAM-dependent methyltransferase
MVEQAKQAWEKSLAGNPAYAAAPAVKFEVRDVMKTGYPDETFDAIICNRLLHHFIEPATRVAALSELARISKGTIVASFFNSFAIDAVMFKVKNRLKSKIPDDRIPIAMNQFLADASDAGLQLDESFPTRWGVSPQWYVRLRKK